MKLDNKQIIQSIQDRFPNSYNEIIELFDISLVGMFHDFLQDKNEIGGFFSKKDSETIFERHMIENLFYVYSLHKRGLVSRETKVLDVGTGPGLPGFFFVCLKDAPSVTLLDSARRKLSLTEDWWNGFELEVERDNIKVNEKDKVHLPKKLQFVYVRVEECEGEFDLATMRATVPYPFSIEVICRIVKKGGIFCPFLGKELEWKSKESEILSNCGFIMEDDIVLEELSFLGERKFKVLKKKASPKHGIPRDWKHISKDIKGAEWAK
ncbi:MAG: class I SAM-dependent methyltransferase [Leptospira sp.]|nr:class I SAM-dependent methyltransferase [Leptospira sp.]